MTRIVIHIDRLVLKGFPHEHRHAFGEGLLRELARVFADTEKNEVPFTDRHVPRLHAGNVEAGAAATQESIGGQVGQRIGGRIPS